jgi:phytoene dehydrogenase-like protein
VTVLEARPVLGGASISAKVFEGVDARLSKYSYLISLLPWQIREELGIELTTIRRGISSYTPDPADPERGLAISIDYDDTLDDEMARLTGSAKDADAWRAFYERTTRVAERVFPTLTQPLMTRRQMQDLVDNDADWSDFF